MSGTPTANASGITITAVGSVISASATQYTAQSLPVSSTETIDARVLSGGTWSVLSYATLIENLAPDIRIAEMNYDPLPATAAEQKAGYVVSDTTDPNKDFQFVELQNISSQTIDLLGLQFTNGISFTFPDVTLAAGGYIVVCADPAAFALRYG